LVQLEKEGKSEYTKRNIEKFLEFINRKADLDNPDEVLLFISRHQVTNNTKEALSYAYRKYCRYYNIQAKIPFYEPDPKSIIPPTTEKVEILISNASRIMCTKLTLSKETGLRPIEIHSLKVKDVELEQRIVRPTTAKHGASRVLRISSKLATMIQEQIIRHNLNQNDQLFKGTATQYGKNFRELRNRLAKKLKEPTIHNIRLYDLRHYFCTKKCKQIQNPWIVMGLMGHKRLETTQIYMHLSGLEESEWIVESTTDQKRADELLRQDFTYILTTPDGYMKFRKPK